MDYNQKLYEFLKDKTWQLTEDWYASLDKRNSGGVYTMEDPDAVQRMKEQNHEFYKRFNLLFIEDRERFLEDFEEWVVAVATDENHIRTPLHFILKEFFRAQSQYIDLIHQFSKVHKDKFGQDQIEIWYQEVINAVGKINRMVYS